MSWLLEIIIERRRLDSKGLWEAVLHFAVSSPQQKVELLRSLNKLINKPNDNDIDPAALNRERPTVSLCAKASSLPNNAWYYLKQNVCFVAILRHPPNNSHKTLNSFPENSKLVRKTNSTTGFFNMAKYLIF